MATGAMTSGGRKAEYGRVKIQLGFQTANDGVGLAEPVLLAFERDIGDRQPLAPHGVGHQLRLVRWHDAILEPLEEDEGTGQTVGRVNR